MVRSRKSEARSFDGSNVWIENRALGVRFGGRVVFDFDVDLIPFGAWEVNLLENIRFTRVLHFTGSRVAGVSG